MGVAQFGLIGEAAGRADGACVGDAPTLESEGRVFVGLGVPRDCSGDSDSFMLGVVMGAAVNTVGMEARAMDGPVVVTPVGLEDSPASDLSISGASSVPIAVGTSDTSCVGFCFTASFPSRVGAIVGFRLGAVLPLDSAFVL